MIKIFAELSLPEAVAQGNVGGTNNTRVCLQHSLGTQPFKFAVLKNAQNFYLRQRTHFRNFVEKNSAPICQLELAFQRLLSAGKRAFFVTEKLALEQGIAHGRRVEGDERALSARGRIVNRVREQSLPGTGFSEQHDRHVRLRC